MASFNRVIMMGHLTRDPQLSYLPSQTPVVEFGLASNRRWRSKEGEQREETCFIDCQAFGRMAENISKYCKKGRPLLIEGRLSFNQWETPEGVKRSKHRIHVDNFTFVDTKAEAESYGASAPSDSGGMDPGQAPPKDDIPF
jgi:single-strand DNA-binding protein